MVLENSVCHPAVPVVSFTNMRLAVLAVTLDEGWLVWAWPVTAASTTASVNIPPINLLFFVSFMFPFLLEPMWLYRGRAESALALGFSGFSTVRFFPISSQLAHTRQNGKA